MDKLNKELIAVKDRLTHIEEEIIDLNNEYALLQDKIHLCFDSKYLDTTDAEKYIIAEFWASAYEKYKDGGYITNDVYLSEVRFAYEVELINSIIDKKCQGKKKAIDICCGNGRYTHEFSKRFNQVIGLDLSEGRIVKNTKDTLNNTSGKNIKFINADFMDTSNSDLGTFDFIFVSDIFTYTDKSKIEVILKRLLDLLTKDGLLLIRESTMIIGHEDYKSKNYVAYYRNSKFYKKGFFKDNFKKSYRNYGYNLYHLDKYFNVNKDARRKVKDMPSLLKTIVKESVSENLRTCHFYTYGK